LKRSCFVIGPQSVLLRDYREHYFSNALSLPAYYEKASIQGEK
jgi:hypothetical protein